MLWTIAAILMVMWVLGLVTSYTIGGFIHILLVVAIIVVAIKIIQGRRTIRRRKPLARRIEEETGGFMSPRIMIAVVLVVLGIVVLAYSGITYKTRANLSI